MHLLLDCDRNTVVVNGTRYRGRHRWEAALLRLLLQAGGAGLDRATLDAALTQAGARQPLTRRQIGRLLDSLHALFTQAGAGDELAQRLVIADRQRTVGPWRWHVLAGDGASLVPAAWPTLAPVTDAALAQAAPPRLPALAKGGALVASARLCRRLLVAQALFHEGHLVAAAAELADDAAWQSESAELAAWRHARAAEAHWKLRNDAAALRAIDAAEAAVSADDLAERLLGSAVRLLRPRMAYALDPLANAQAALQALKPLLPLPSGLHALCRSSAGLACNQAALCQRRLAEQALRDGDGAAARRWQQHAVAGHLAALFCFATAEQTALAQSATANLAYLLGTMAPQADPGNDCRWADVLDWFGISQAWHNRFELPDASTWESIFLGELWLDHAAARSDFAAAGMPAGWEGRAPDTLAFHQTAADRARELADPRQLAHALLNLWRFARHTGPAAAGAASAAAVELQALLAERPALRSLLLAEGHRLPPPDRAGSMGDAARNPFT